MDHAAQDKLTDLKVQRANLLGRYKADASPVRDMDAQIAALERTIAAGGAQGEGARRVGVNPIYQTVQSDKIQAAAQISALQQSSQALAAQIEQVTERQLRLAQLEPQYQGPDPRPRRAAEQCARFHGQGSRRPKRRTLSPSRATTTSPSSSGPWSRPRARA